MFEWLKRKLGGKSSDVASTSAASPLPAAPFEVVAVSGSEVAKLMASWADRPGFTPVLLGDRASFEQAIELIDLNEESSDEILSAGLALDADAWLRERVASEDDYYQFDESVSGSPEPIPSLSPTRDLLGRSIKECIVGLVPSAEPWHVPAVLKPGGWNECPEPHAHLALFRRWYERYGAIVTTVTSDIIEFRVARPPQSESEALALAKEQFVYCSDIVYQGTNTLGNLAATLRGSPNWYFWWD